MEGLTQFIKDSLAYLPPWLQVVILAMVPVIEIRGAVPLGAVYGMPWWQSLLFGVIGNMIPVPFVILFGEAVLNWLKKIKVFAPFAGWVERRARNKSGEVTKYSLYGLAIFVGIPLPGTGAVTGSVIAAFLNMKLRHAIPSILAGVIAAGLIMTGISYGAISFLEFLK